MTTYRFSNKDDVKGQVGIMQRSLSAPDPPEENSTFLAAVMAAGGRSTSVQDYGNRTGAGAGSPQGANVPQALSSRASSTGTGQMSMHQDPDTSVNEDLFFPSVSAAAAITLSPSFGPSSSKGDNGSGNAHNNNMFYPGYNASWRGISQQQQQQPSRTKSVEEMPSLGLPMTADALSQSSQSPRSPRPADYRLRLSSTNSGSNGHPSSEDGGDVYQLGTTMSRMQLGTGSGISSGPNGSGQVPLRNLVPSRQNSTGSHQPQHQQNASHQNPSAQSFQQHQQMYMQDSIQMQQMYEMMYYQDGYGMYPAGQYMQTNYGRYPQDIYQGGYPAEGGSGVNRGGDTDQRHGYASSMYGAPMNSYPMSMDYVPQQPPRGGGMGSRGSYNKSGPGTGGGGRGGRGGGTDRGDRGDRGGSSGGIHQQQQLWLAQQQQGYIDDSGAGGYSSGQGGMDGNHGGGGGYAGHNHHHRGHHQSGRNLGGNIPSTRAGVMLDDLRSHMKASSATQRQRGMMPQPNGYPSHSSRNAHSANAMYSSLGGGGGHSSSLHHQQHFGGQNHNHGGGGGNSGGGGSGNVPYTLNDVRGHAVEFAQDQFGSRWLQQQLSSPSVSAEDKQSLFMELLPAAKELAGDTFGNYCVQILLNPQVGTPEQQLALCKTAFEGNMLSLSRNTYACRCIQSLVKLFQLGDSVIPITLQDKMLRELEQDVISLVMDSNANHVAQQIIERVRPVDRIRFVLDALKGKYILLAKDPYGCRVCQRVLEHATPEFVEPALEELLKDVEDLVTDSMGNYVVQHIVTASGDRYGPQKMRLVESIKQRLLMFATHKFASNVVEKVLEYGDTTTRREIIQLMLDGQATIAPGVPTVPIMQVMMSDLFANYVCQRSLAVAERDQLIRLVAIVRDNAHELRKMTYGKHILSACEKAAAAAGIP